MKLLIALILAAPLFAFAKDTDKKVESAETKVPVKEGYGSMNMNEFKGLEGPPTRHTGVTFSTGCKSKAGVEYKSTDAGYQGCLMEAQSDNAAGNKTGASPNMGFKIGD